MFYLQISSFPLFISTYTSALTLSNNTANVLKEILGHFYILIHNIFLEVISIIM